MLGLADMPEHVQCPTLIPVSREVTHLQLKEINDSFYMHWIKYKIISLSSGNPSALALEKATVSSGQMQAKCLEQE
jgi:hypothetical protein